MKTFPIKYLMGKINLRSALVLSFAFHVVLAALGPSLAWNRTTPLKEKNHNKVRITMVKKEVGKPKPETSVFKPKSIREPQRIQMAKGSMRTPQKIQLPPALSRSHFRSNNPVVQVAQVTPKTQATSNARKRIVNRPRTKRVEPIQTNDVYRAPLASFVPSHKVNLDMSDSGSHARVARINSNAGFTLKQEKLSLKTMASSSSAESVYPNLRSQLISSGSQRSNGIRVANLAPRQMVSLESDESPGESEIASDVLEKILNDFYRKVGRQISHAKIYPDFARKKGYQGRTMIAFRINRDGTILSLSVSQSSGHEILDEAALESVKEAGPYPPIPGEIKQSVLKFIIPISYALR